MFVSRSMRSVMLVTLLLLLIVSNVQAQTTTSLTDGSTPPAMAPGAPAGSYPLSGLDNINFYNGKLSFRLPLVGVGGRGEAQYTMTLPIEHRWRLESITFCANCETYYYAAPAWWDLIPIDYGPGKLEGRHGAVYPDCGPATPSSPLYTLTRLTFTARDGTEYELRDQQSNGQPKYFPLACTSIPSGSELSRGTVFVSADGSGMTFISDTTIYDSFANGLTLYPTGTLRFRDGRRYRIEQGPVSWIQDRNGNRLEFTYDSGLLTQITDSLNRKVSITYADPTVNRLYDEIGFKGFGGATRTLKVWRKNLDQALRPGYSIQTIQQLFPTLTAFDPNPYNPRVVSSVELPDGRSYSFRYNSYGELARVDLPTGGALEYDFDSGIGGTSGGVLYEAVAPYAPYMIYRRVVERRVYREGGALEHKMVIAVPNLSTPFVVAVEYRDANGTPLASGKHYYYGRPDDAAFQEPVDYPAWRQGKEYQSEVTDRGGPTVLRRLEHTWQQRAPVSWWSGSADFAPPNDPRITQTDTTLTDTNQVTRQSFSYDQYNNKTDVSEYDYGVGAPGSLLRRTHTDYLTTHPANGADYTATSIHLRSLPLAQTVSDGAGTQRARTTYEYDNYTGDANHAALTGRPGISGLDPAFSASYLTRGNVTAISRWLNTTGSDVATYQQYDIAGNVVKSIDARGFAATFDFSDRFGAPNGEARSNTSPAELAGQTSYAFPTFVTNAAGHGSYAQYDYYLGRPVDAEDPNGAITKTAYNDLLDRPTQVVRAAGTAVQTQTTFTYDDANRTVRTTNDQNAFGDNRLRTEVVYDGLGRESSTATYEDLTVTWVFHLYDAMGRASQISNPWRFGAVLYTATQYDPLGRVASVTTPDGARVTTSYSGSQTTVTDQAGKAWRTVADALGRVVQVVEDPAGLAYQTTHTYDALDNLTAVTQGVQVRSFVYDSLSRLTNATNPESATVTYQYDNNDNLLRKTDARGVVTTMSYDPLNRVLSRTYSDGTPTVYLYYDEPLVTNSKERLTKVASSVSTYRYQNFDALGRVTQSQQETAGQWYDFVYSYDRSGNLTSQTYPSGRLISTTYDLAGRASAVSGSKPWESAKTYVSLIDYAAHGAIKQMKLGALWEHTDFDSRLQPTAIGLGTGTADSSVAGLAYDYGSGVTNNGNVLSQTISWPTGLSVTQSYSYDSVNRLHAFTESGFRSQTYDYDRHGNRWVSGYKPFPTLTPSSQSDFNSGTNRLAAHLYDAAGNTTSNPVGSFTYDAENRQISLTAPMVGTVTYAYDGEGRRVKKMIPASSTTVYVYDAFGQLAAEYRDVGTLMAGGTSYLTADHLGSTRVVTDAGGVVKSRRDYFPFGEEIDSGRDTALGYFKNDGINHRFTGKERDGESGFGGVDYFLARYYSGGLGRFHSVDPDNAGAQADDPQSWNGYAYGRNNPLLYTDPTGEDYRVCGINDNDKVCADLDDDQWKEYVKRYKNVTLVANKIYIRNYDSSRTLIGTADFFQKEPYEMLAGVARQVGPPVKALAAATLAFVGAGMVLEIGATYSASSFVPGWFNRLEGHHGIPFFLGGKAKQVLSSLPRQIHRDEFHSLLRRELRNAGFSLKVGGRGYGSFEWAKYMSASPGLQRAAFDAVLRVARSIDSKYGTQLAREFLSNLAKGNFRPF